MWEILSFILAGLSITGLWLNAKKNILCWPIWLVSSILWAVYFIHQADVASSIMWLVYTSFNIFGWFSWHRDNEKKVEENINNKILRSKGYKWGVVHGTDFTLGNDIPDLSFKK